MKKSLNAWSVESTLDFEQTFRAVSEAGFEGIELNIDAPGRSAHSLSMETTQVDYAFIQALSQKYALPVVSISTSLSAGMSGIPEKHESYRSLLRKQIEAAKALGAGGILTSPGGMAPGITLQSARQSTITFFKAMKAEIEASGVFVGLENVWNGFFLSPYDMTSMFEEINSTSIGAYLDTGNMIAFSTSEYWAEVLGKWIGYVHVKDFLRNSHINSGGTWVDITHGSADWHAIIPALRQAGFDGYLTGEVFKSDDSMSYPDYYNKVSSEIGEIITY